MYKSDNSFDSNLCGAQPKLPVLKKRTKPRENQIYFKRTSVSRPYVYYTRHWVLSKFYATFPQFAIIRCERRPSARRPKGIAGYFALFRKSGAREKLRYECGAMELAWICGGGTAPPPLHMGFCGKCWENCVSPHV